jgi:hypothetical protein
MSLGHQQIVTDIGQRDVVLRVVRPLPDIQGPGRVEHLLACEIGPDAARHRLDVVHRSDHGWIVVHCGSRRYVLVRRLLHD